MRFLAVALLVMSASMQGIPVVEDIVEDNIIVSDGAVSFVRDDDGIITEDDVLIHCQGLDNDEFDCSIYGVELWLEARR